MKEIYQIDFKGPAHDTLENLLSKYNSEMYLILDAVLQSYQSFRIVFQDILDIMKLGFEKKEIRTKPIRFKIHTDDETYHTLELCHFLSNMIFWEAFMDMDHVDLLNENDIIDFTNFNMGSLCDYIDDRILPNHEGDFHAKNKTIDEIAYKITAISNAFSLLIGNSISVYNIIQSAKEKPEIDTLMHEPIDDNLQPAEAEEILNARTARLKELFCECEESDLRPLFKSGKDLSDGQFREIAVKIGHKSDMHGNTIPVIINANLLVDGISKPSYHYIEAQSGNKSLILTKTKMGDPGALSKKLNRLATSASYLRKDYEKCDSTEYVTYNIRNDLFLKLLNHRYYYDERGNVKQVDYKRDKQLIGKVVPFMSPATCSSKDGICCYCYGGLFDINKDLASVGSFAATKDSEPVGQRVLSSKHLQATMSKLINMLPGFDDNFELNANEITVKDSDHIDDLYIILGPVGTEESDDGDLHYVEYFDVVDPNNKIVAHIAEENGANLYFSDLMMDTYKQYKYGTGKCKPISLNLFDDDDSTMFIVEIKNKELTEPIKIFNKLLNSKDKYGARTVSELCQKMADSFIEQGIKNDFVHHECIIRGLLRKKSNIHEFPDWSRNGDHTDYQILSLNAALFSNPSPTVSLTYGYMKKQLTSPDLYTKEAPSHLDPLFVSNLKEYLNE
jgi:hypothetical protein